MPADPLPPPRESIADSPWFWVGLFAGMALLALIVVAPKYAQRQGRIEQRHENRQRMAEEQQGVVARDPAAADGTQPTQPGLREARARTSLLPLLLFVGLVLCVSLVFIARRRYRTRSRQTDAALRP